MSIIVQKFAGTSVATAKCRQRVLRHISNELEKEQKTGCQSFSDGKKRGEPYATHTLLGFD